MKIFCLLSVLILTGCATSFSGSAHVTPQECQAKCESWGMTLDGMVAMGEYSDACVCGKNGRTTKVAPVDAGAVGVILQMERQRQAALASMPKY